jgi:hypothetical protein
MSKQSRIRQKHRDQATIAIRKHVNAFWVFGVLILSAAVACAFLLTGQKVKPTLADKNSAPSDLDPEEELEKLLTKRDRDIDLSLVNWLIVADIPEFHDLLRKDYFNQLDDVTREVKDSMVKMEAKGWPDANSDDPKTRCRRFCSAIIGNHFDYVEDFKEENLTPTQMRSMYSNPDNLFLAGLLRTKEGTCVSLPMIYLVVGQRLGMPVHLVEIGKHYFIRWDEPKFSVDIEATSTGKIAWTQDESVYLDSEGMTRDQLRGSDLKNLTNHEVVGELLFARTSYWHQKGPNFEGRSSNDLVRAHQLAPDDPGIGVLYQTVFSRQKT